MPRTETAQYQSLRKALLQLRQKFADDRPSDKAVEWKKSKRDHFNKRLELWCVDLNRKFANVHEAAAFAGANYNTIYDALSGRHEHKAVGHVWRWRRIPEEQIAAEQSLFREYIGARCLIGDGRYTHCPTLFADHQQWAAESKVNHLDRKAFYDYVRALPGVRKTKKWESKKCLDIWHGIALTQMA